jgi:hypothetical protein
MKLNNEDDKKIGNIIMSALDEIEKVSKTGDRVVGLRSGFRDLDYKT